VKKTIIAVLASLMLAGILAGATQPVASGAPTAVVSIDGRFLPVFGNAPILPLYGDSTSR
jgi:hypothetical protein